MPKEKPVTFPDRQANSLHVLRVVSADIDGHYEGIGLLRRCLDGYWEEVKKREYDQTEVVMLSSLVHLAALAQRIVEDRGMINEGTDRLWPTPRTLSDQNHDGKENA